MSEERVVLEIELPGFNTEGIRDAAKIFEEVGEPPERALREALEEALNLERDTVSITIFVAPSEKETNDQWFFVPMEGVVVGMRLTPKGST